MPALVIAWLAGCAGTSEQPKVASIAGDAEIAIKAEPPLEPIVATEPADTTPANDPDCPSELGRVTITERQLELADPIYFRVGKTKLRDESLPLIDEIAQVLRLCPEITIEVQVHTDSRGMRSWNYWLSHDRARAITNALADRGIAEKRLRYQGFGESCPIYTEDPDPAVQRRLLRRTEIWRTDGRRPGGCPRPDFPPMPAEYERQRQ
jgi:outer membrane protein OmpA-like peptidoglycan-associated protein